MYGSFWLLVAIHAGSIAVEEDNPRWLQLTVTACMNTLLFMLTGKTRGDLKGQLRAGVRRTAERRGYYLSAGAFAAGGVALSLHLDVPDLLYVTMGGTVFLLVCAFIFN